MIIEMGTKVWCSFLETFLNNNFFLEVTTYEKITTK